jgi:hypothetical protein
MSDLILRFGDVNFKQIENESSHKDEVPQNTTFKAPTSN